MHGGIMFPTGGARRQGLEVKVVDNLPQVHGSKMSTTILPISALPSCLARDGGGKTSMGASSAKGVAQWHHYAGSWRLLQVPCCGAVGMVPISAGRQTRRTMFCLWLATAAGRTGSATRLDAGRCMP